MEKSKTKGEAVIRVYGKKRSFKIFIAKIAVILLFSRIIETAQIKKTLEGVKEDISKILRIEDKRGEEKRSIVEGVASKEEETEEEKIESLEAGKKLFEEGSYVSALKLFSLAQRGELKGITAEKRKKLERVIGMYKAQSYFQLGKFIEAAQEVLSLGVLDGEGREILKKAEEYSKLDRNSSEEEIDNALRECVYAADLLKVRIEKRMRKKEFNLALLDIEVLAEIEEEKKTAEHLLIQCYFLSGKYRKGLEELKKKEDCSILYEKASNIVQKYENMNKYYSKCTASNYRLWKSFVDKDLLLGKITDARFNPTIFMHIRMKSFEKVIQMGIMLKESPEKVIAYSEKLLKEHGPVPTQKELSEHVKVIVAMNRFTLALDTIKHQMDENSEEYAEIKKLYNEKLRIAREKKEKEDEERKKKEAEEREKARQEALKKEKSRSQRRIKIVKSKRSARADPEGFYKFLGVRNRASDKDLMKAYRTISKKANISLRRHQNNAAEVEKCKKTIIQANKAKDVLSNQILKEEYDSGYYMTEKEKEAWGYNDDMIDQYEGHGSHGRDSFGDADLFDILMNGGGFGGGFGGGSGGFGGGFGRRGTHRVVYYM